MDRVAVRSTDLAIVGYESSTATLEVAFKNGKVYQYTRVPENMYRDLMAAPSHGQYFNDHIKDAFAAVRIN